MNKINQSQNKQNNNKYKYMTIQSRMNKEYTIPASAGLAPSEWATNLSNKNPKEINKTQNPIDPIQLPASHANAAKHLCHRAGLSPALAPRKSQTGNTWIPQPPWKRE
jgi:hypothetical protein